MKKSKKIEKLEKDLAIKFLRYGRSLREGGKEEIEKSKKEFIDAARRYGIEYSGQFDNKIWKRINKAYKEMEDSFIGSLALRDIEDYLLRCALDLKEPRLTVTLIDLLLIPRPTYKKKIDYYVA